ncbi:MAG: DJ-1/PfpI family protein [Spartobacteria bacterium]
MRAKEIGLIGFDGVTASHLTAPADVFAAAALDDGFGGRLPCYRVRTIGLTNRPFAAECGMLFRPHHSFATAPPLDTIIVAGGSGLRRAATCDQVAEWISSCTAETARIAAICTGIYALAPTGLLDGREVTTHWRCARDLQQRYPALRVDHKRRLVKDGPFYTSAGLTAGVDLALALIEDDYGKQVAQTVRRDLMTYLTAEDSPNDHMRPRDFDRRPIDRFGELVAWIMRNLHQNLTVEVLAREACMCPAHFTRAFKSVFGSTPGEFVENIRLNEAHRRLSSRGKTVCSVAASVGFTDANAFRRAFERRFGDRPGAVLNGSDAIPTTFRPKFARVGRAERGQR